MPVLTNAQFWDMARRLSPSFKSHTSKETDSIFTDKGFEALKRTDLTAINEFFELSLRIALNKIDTADGNNPLISSGLVAKFDTPNGAYAQRLSINALKPVSPAFLNLNDGDSIDPFVVRKPEVGERFFGVNFQYQNLVTLQEFQVKQIFISMYGMDEFTSGILKGLETGYKVQEYLNTKEALNSALKSTKYPLQDSQKIKVKSWTAAEPTDDEIRNLIKTTLDVKTTMETVAQSTAYNAYKFNTAINTSDLVLLLRAGIMNEIKTKTLYGAFNKDELAFPMEVVEVDNFGGLEHYKEAGFQNKVYPVYDKLGSQIGWADSEGQSSSKYTDDQVFVKDTNADILGIICQKGLIVETSQNAYTVQPIYNPRGMYSNYWANRPNTGVNVDPLYTMVAIYAK